MFALDFEKRIRVMRKVIESTGISEELRGYSWEKPPVEPINDVRISVSDLNSFCSTRRNVFLKYVMKEKVEPNKYMLRGLAYHRVIRETIVSLKKAIYSGCDSGEEIIDKYFSSTTIPDRICRELKIADKECRKLYRYIVLQVASRVDAVLSRYDADAENIVGLVLPPFVERIVDGSFIGLSRLSVDIFTPYNAIMDFKSGYGKDEHQLSLTGYALALEADEEMDVNYGFLVYVRVDKNVRFKVREFVITDELRREFIEVRDEIAEIIDSGIDPGKPPECSKYCSYYVICNEDCC